MDTEVNSVWFIAPYLAAGMEESTHRAMECTHSLLIEQGIGAILTLTEI